MSYSLIWFLYHNIIYYMIFLSDITIYHHLGWWIWTPIEAATRTLPWCTARLHRRGLTSPVSPDLSLLNPTVQLCLSVFCLFVHLSIYLYRQIYVYIYIYINEYIYIYFILKWKHIQAPSMFWGLHSRSWEGSWNIFFECTSGSRLDVPCPWPPCCVTASLPPRTLAEVRDGRGWMSGMDVSMLCIYIYSHPGIHRTYRTWNFRKNIT